MRNASRNTIKRAKRLEQLPGFQGKIFALMVFTRDPQNKNNIRKTPAGALIAAVKHVNYMVSLSRILVQVSQPKFLPGGVVLSINSLGGDVSPKLDGFENIISGKVSASPPIQIDHSPIKDAKDMVDKLQSAMNVYMEVKNKSK
jgi:hypothetical protein